MDIKKIIQEAEKELREVEKQPLRFQVPIKSEDFKTLFKIIAKKILEENYCEDTNFEINSHNTYVINQLYYYLVMSDNFNGNLKKGIILCGPYGTGKTTILEIIKRIIEKVTIKRITFVSSMKLPELFEEKGMDYYYRRPIILDEIGREAKEINDYGTKKYPMIELLTHRYNHKALTFGTSNFSEDKLTGKNCIYGEYIGERLKEMFNFIELKGNSRRK
jgi:DNA replication protein DnaC